MYVKYMIYVRTDVSSESLRSVEDCEDVDIENYEFKDSLFSYLDECFNGVETDLISVINEIRMYNVEMGIVTDERAIYNVILGLGLIKEIP